jgi:hypothetical protein
MARFVLGLSECPIRVVASNTVHINSNPFTTMAPAYSHAHWRENWILEAMIRERSLQSGRDPSVASRCRCEYDEREALSPRPIALVGNMPTQRRLPLGQ